MIFNDEGSDNGVLILSGFGRDDGNSNRYCLFLVEALVFYLEIDVVGSDLVLLDRFDVNVDAVFSIRRDGYGYGACKRFRRYIPERKV